MAKKKSSARKVSANKVGHIRSPLTFDAIELSQSSQKMYLLSAPASTLFEALSINRRVEDKDEGYQRTLSMGRVNAIASFIISRKSPIPSALIVSFDKGTFDSRSGVLTVPAGNNVGWVIDGQHRLAGCHAAATQGVDVELPVVAFVGLTEQKQIEQFVTINRESKNVPTSLYLDLLGKLPHKKAGEAAKERAADIGTQLKQDSESVFFEKIVVTTSPHDGQISLTNFVRKIAPLLIQGKGLLEPYTIREQTAVINNYFKGLSLVFSREFERKGSIFFKTVGFGALWNVFPNFFSQTLGNHGGFQVKDVAAVFSKIKNFDFDSWRQWGSGSQAEINAAEDLRAALLFAFKTDAGSDGSSLKV